MGLSTYYDGDMFNDNDTEEQEKIKKGTTGNTKCMRRIEQLLEEKRLQQELENDPFWDTGED